MQLTQREYDICVFLSQLIYTKVVLPQALRPSHTVKTLSGLRADIFEFEEVTYICFSGTNGLFAINDWICNIKMFLGIVPGQFKEAMKFVKEEIGDKRTIVCSHSLGGAIAQYCVVRTSADNVCCINFNPAGIRHILKPKKHNLYEDNIWNIVTHRDILYRLTAILPFNWMKNVGKTIIIQDDISWNGIKSHSAWEIFERVGLKDIIQINNK